MYFGGIFQSNGLEVLMFGKFIYLIIIKQFLCVNDILYVIKLQRDNYYKPIYFFIIFLFFFYSPSKLFQKEVYVARPVTAPREAGFLLTVLTEKPPGPVTSTSTT